MDIRENVVKAELVAHVHAAQALFESLLLNFLQILALTPIAAVDPRVDHVDWQNVVVDGLVDGAVRLVAHGVGVCDVIRPETGHAPVGRATIGICVSLLIKKAR